MSWHATPHDLDLYARGCAGRLLGRVPGAAPDELRLVPGHGRRSRRPLVGQPGQGGARPAARRATAIMVGARPGPARGVGEHHAPAGGQRPAAGLVGGRRPRRGGLLAQRRGHELQPDLAGGLPRAGPGRAAPRRGHGLRPPGRPGLRDRRGLADGRRTARPGAIGRRDRRVGPDHGGALVPAPGRQHPGLRLVAARPRPRRRQPGPRVVGAGHPCRRRAGRGLGSHRGGRAERAPRTSADAFARGFVAFRPAGQIAFALATLVAGAVVLARRSTTMEVLR